LYAATITAGGCRREEFGVPVQYEGEEFIFHNSDGSEVAVRGWGNQFAAVFETLEGYTVVEDPASGDIHYAVLSDDGTRLEPSGIPVETRPRDTGSQSADQQPGERPDLPMAKHLRVSPQAMREAAMSAHDSSELVPRWETRSQRRSGGGAGPSASDADDEVSEGDGPLAAAVGDFVGLVLLIQFPDVPGTIPAQEVTNYCNALGYSGFGNNGSVRDYFRDVSGGRMNYTNVVAAYYTAQHNRSHYTDPNIAYGTRAQELIHEALGSLRASGFNFSQLTADGGGFVRALNVFYAGPTVNNWSQGLWPHAWTLQSRFTASSTRTFADYQITNMGTQLTLGTFCHENGHMVCDFPDLYDYGGESRGVGRFCVMCVSSPGINPVHPCAYLKNDAGWTSSLQTVASGMSYTVRSGTNNFLIHRKSQSEFFIVENRAQSGRDASLPDAGLAIWHVDVNGSNSNEQMSAAQHYKCSLEQADGQFHMEKGVNSGDANDLYGGAGGGSFTGSGTPNSRWWDGSASGLAFTSISNPGPAMVVTTGAVWRNDRTVLRTHAKYPGRSAWALMEGDGYWLPIAGGSSDGTMNIHTALSEARANGRMVDILVDAGRITEVTLK
jgi:M6 family metalloprotease-like protein